MILQFTVKNFRSIKNEVTVHFVSHGSNKAKKLDLIKGANEQYLLPSVGVFGANASGKSNLLKALLFMVSSMSAEQSLKNPPSNNALLQPYKLDKDCLNKPTFFQIVLCGVSEGYYKEYVYGFEIGSRYITSEQLVLKEKVKTNFTTRTVFKRRLNEKTGLSEYEFHSRDKKQLKPLSERVIEEGLALTVFALNKSSIAREVLNLVNTSLTNGRPALFYFVAMANHEGVNNLAFELYRQKPALLEDVNFMMAQVDFGIQNVSINDRGAFTSHRQYGDNATSEIFSLLNDESVGTQKFFSTSLIISDALRTGGVVIVDDLGVVMHPLLTAEIVKLFNNSKTNPQGAQLFYNSHEDYLLSPEVGLRKDQIYFTKKDTQEVTQLHSLSEYDIREILDFRRNYLFGRFGALPNLRLSEYRESKDV